MTKEHFADSLKHVRPSGLNQFQTNVPKTSFSNIFGIDDVIEELRLSILEPLSEPEQFAYLGIQPPRGILLYGPPGVGKTMLCCAIAHESGINYLLVESSQLRSKIVGESERNITNVFAHAKSLAPCILFIDQIDTLAPARGTSRTSENTNERIVTCLLTEMDGFFTRSGSPEIEVLVVAVTNRPEVIDPALLRPGRLDQHVYIPPPDFERRRAIVAGISKSVPLQLTTDETILLCSKTEGYSGADLDNLCREAALISLKEDPETEKVTYKQIVEAMNACKPSLLDYVPRKPFE